MDYFSGGEVNHQFADLDADLDGHSRRHMAVAVAMDIDDRYFHIQARRFINLYKPTVNGFIWIYDGCEELNRH
jgi:hypothetical protein